MDETLVAYSTHNEFPYHKIGSFPVNNLQFVILFVGASLEQSHIFALAHILRRPIIVYGVKYVKSFRGESLGLARFQGNAVTKLYE